MNKWQPLTEVAQLKEIKEASFERPQLIFKHSTRCSLSSMAFNRLQEGLPLMGLYIVDVIKDRQLSNLIAQKFLIAHQSPQVLVIHQNSCIYNASHFDISSRTINEEINFIDKV